MKRNLIIKAVAVFLVLTATLCSLCSCTANSGKTALELGNNKMTVGMYSLMASVFKGTIAYGNANINTDSYWQTVADSSGKTYEQYFNERTLEMAKETLYKLALFDELGLSLPKNRIDAIDEELEYWVEYDGEGSRDDFNAILASYGANYDILRDYMIVSAKLEYLAEYMYGGGKLISDTVKQEYLEENYVCFKQILLPFYTYEYELDENNDKIYYLDDGKIAYDKTKGDPVDSDGDGKYNRDANNDVIYYTQDDKGDIHICYDTVNGKEKVRVDASGNYVTKEMKDNEKSDVWNLANEVYAKIQKGNFNGFEALLDLYDENVDSDGALIYLNREVTYSIFSANDTVDELRDAVAELEIGEATIIRSESGMHLLMRYDVEDKAWDKSENAGYFSDETGIADFNANLINKLFSAEIEKVKARVGEIKVNKEALEGFSIKNVGVNYNFY